MPALRGFRRLEEYSFSSGIRTAIWFVRLMKFLGLLPVAACALHCQAQPVMESLPGKGVWSDPRFKQSGPGARVRATIWFDKQFLGDGSAFLRRTREFTDVGRTIMRRRVIAALKAASMNSRVKAEAPLAALSRAGTISSLQYTWIVNGFSCTTTAGNVDALRTIPGVRKIFHAGPARESPPHPSPDSVPGVRRTPVTTPPAFDPGQYPPLWYVEKLGASKVWKELGITGKGTLNIIHDGNFIPSPWIKASLHHNPAEKLNGQDDDGNGLVDDLHGYDFSRGTGDLIRRPLPPGRPHPSILHGHQCVSIICGRGSEEHPVQPGLAPEARWAGVIAISHIEDAVQWAIEQGADTYSMSFSRPRLGHYRSHWRKLMEHGAFCGVHFISGAGNYAQEQPIPIQMRIPEDIPHAVFAVAGVQRDLGRTPFSSQGPVGWNTSHYRDGRVEKPEACAFNHLVPLLPPGGGRPTTTCSGNSFAGPMACGTIALMLSANPELKPWETRAIIIRTATDVAEEGFDFQTGHGLINAFKAVSAALPRGVSRD